MKTAALCILTLFLDFGPVLLVWAVCCHAIGLHLSGGHHVHVIITPKNPRTPPWKRAIVATHQRIKAKAALEWARQQFERGAGSRRRPGGVRG